jgi:hypothetical protein
MSSETVYVNVNHMDEHMDNVDATKDKEDGEITMKERKSNEMDREEGLVFTKAVAERKMGCCYYYCFRRCNWL